MMIRPLVRHAVVSGGVASVTSTLALLATARAEGKGALRPTNATSHWLNGEDAARVEAADVTHTAVGYVTHHAATVFWAVLFEAWASRHPARTPRRLLGGALAVAGVAAAVDYGATPRRFTPGWEFVLSKRSMALVYAAMAVGMAAGAVTDRADAAGRGFHRKGRG